MDSGINKKLAGPLHRRSSWQIFGGAKDILPEFPQTCPKNFCAANFPSTNSLQQLFTHYQLSQALKHEDFFWGQNNFFSLIIK